MARTRGMALKTGDAGIPARIAPMLAQSTADPFDSDKHLFEIKWDGVRCIAVILADELQLQNRRFAEMRDRYPELACLAKLPPGTALDAEVVALEEGRPSFNRLAQRDHIQDPRRAAQLAERTPVTLMAFDLLYLRGRSVMNEPVLERKARLSALLAELKSPHVVPVDHVIGRGLAYFQAAEQHGLEGILAKRIDSPYLCGKRSPFWQKIKVAHTATFDVLGYVPRETGGDFVSALLIGEPVDGGWIFRGRVGAGLGVNEELRADLFRRLRPMPVLKNPPNGAPRESVWRVTRLKCEVRYFEVTKEGMLRGPVLLSIQPA